MYYVSLLTVFLVLNAKHFSMIGRGEMFMFFLFDKSILNGKLLKFNLKTMILDL